MFAQPGTPRSPARVVLFYIGTLTLYGLFWLYSTYQGLNRFYPGASRYHEKQALLYFFVIFYNIVWFFKVIFDLPRAISEAERRAGVPEPIDARMTSMTLLIGGIIGTATYELLAVLQGMPAYYYLPASFIGYTPFLIGLYRMQSELNRLWRFKEAAGE